MEKRNEMKKKEKHIFEIKKRERIRGHLKLENQRPLKRSARFVISYMILSSILACVLADIMFYWLKLSKLKKLAIIKLFLSQTQNSTRGIRRMDTNN